MGFAWIKDGVPTAGDPDLSQALRDFTDANPGSYVIYEQTGEIVYPVPPTVEE